MALGPCPVPGTRVFESFRFYQCLLKPFFLWSSPTWEWEFFSHAPLPPDPVHPISPLYWLLLSVPLYPFSQSAQPHPSPQQCFCPPPSQNNPPLHNLRFFFFHVFFFVTFCFLEPPFPIPVFGFSFSRREARTLRISSQNLFVISKQFLSWFLYLLLSTNSFLFLLALSVLDRHLRAVEPFPFSNVGGPPPGTSLLPTRFFHFLFL